MVSIQQPTGLTISPASSIHHSRTGDCPTSPDQVETSPADHIDKETRISEEHGHNASPVVGPWDAFDDTPLTPQERWHTKTPDDIPFPLPEQTSASRLQQELEEARTRSAMSGTLPRVTSYGPAPISGEDDISPAPAAPWQHHPRDPQSPNANGPFMHYEDVAYLGPEHQPNEKTSATPPERQETFPGIPTGMNRPEARRSWDRQRRQQEKTPSPTSYKSADREGDSRQPRTSVGKHITSWTAEILWSATSLVCLGGIIGVLKAYDGHSLADWPLAISLNALVAFLEALCRVALVVPLMEGMAQLKWNWFARAERPLSDFRVIDDAIRGPVGSAKLLAKQKGRLLGMSGAFGLLTCFASSPLTQLAIEFPTRLVVRGGTTDVARSHSYSQGSLSGELDSRERQSIQQGLYHQLDEEISPLRPTCGTADCQWPSFDTLAICTATADVSDKLVTSSQIEISMTGTGSGDDKIFVYNASLPNGAFLTGSPGTYNLNISSPPSSFPRQGDYLPVTTSLGFSGVDDRVSSAFANLFVIYTNQTTESPQSDRCFRAVEAILYFCVNRYTAAVNSGVVTTTLLRSSPLANLSSPFAVPIGKRQVPTTVIGTAVQATPAPPQSTADAGVIHTEHEGTEYTISRNDVGLLNTYLGSALSGAYSRHYGAAGSTTGAGEVLGTAMFNAGSASETVLSEDEMKMVIANMTRNVATSLSNAIRTATTQPPSSAGTELLPETYIRVRFAWLVFVAAQVALSVAFLAGIVVQTAAWDVEVVKGGGSATAVMMAVSAGAAREMPARLAREGGGRWRLALEPGGGGGG
ncbi:hypothetical protein QBC39DRAFT_325960 [Podospora conica]|nr:hypothetical protein QBC39DRAFT_325960 [Schizothecium conicum]